ncbi:MAG: carbon-nitrogen hydrolase family protein [Chloroflexi bacterium]|nr:carbon-nitrogen hydrolase family protein [Chloroflexota bacterium]
MKEKVKVSLVQFAPEWLSREKNAARLRGFAEREATGGAELIVFPELANIGYISPARPGQPCSFENERDVVAFAARYAREAEPVPGQTTGLLGEVARKRGVYIVVGLAQSHNSVPGTLYNSAVLIGPEGVIGVHHKMHLPFNEKMFFYPGNTAEVFATGLGSIAMNICYDVRFPELSRVQALKGAEIICSIWAAPKVMEIMGEVDTLKYRAYTRAQENSVYFIACNRSGKEGDMEYLGHSAIGAPNGEVIAYAASDEEVTLRAEMYGERLVKARGLMNIYRDRRPEMYSPITEPLSQPYRQPESRKLKRRPARASKTG